MAQAYSNDLRKKLLTAHERGEGSLTQLAKRFGRTSKLTPAMREELQEWIEAQPDLTLAELQKRLAGRKIQVGLTQVWNVLQAMELRLKKSRSTPPNKIQRTARSAAASGARKWAGSIQKS